MAQPGLAKDRLMAIRRSGPQWLLILIPVLFLTVFFLVPFLYAVLVSFVERFPGGSLRSLTTDHYSTLARSFYFDYVISTVSFGFQVTLITLLVGYPVALFMVGRGGLQYRLILLAVITPLLVGVVPRTVGWTILLGVDGLFNRLIQTLGLSSEPIQLLYTRNAAVVGTVHVVLPFMVLSIASVLSGISRSLHEASSSLGATSWQSFWRVTFPLSLPGVTVGSALVFCLAVGAYITPVVLGGGKVKLLGPLAYEQFMSIVNWPLGSAVAVVLTVIALGVVSVVPATVAWWMRRAGR
jgi:putative spermidine/putrescine transport system permease protein